MRPLLSIGVLSVGSPQLPYAVKSLEEQTIEVSHRIIRDKYPFAAAFNELLDICNTPYVIQLDEDMELFPDSAEQMLARFKAAEKSDPSIVQMAFRLSDPVLGNVLGVKLFAVEKLGPIRMFDGQFPDRDFNQTLLDSGFSTIVDSGDPVGWHARHRTDYELFIKHAISASKLARPRAADPMRSDVLRLYNLIKRSESLDIEETLMMLGGVYWGLFNEVRTDVNTYPAEQYANLKNMIAPLCELDKAQNLKDLFERANRLITNTASTEIEPAFYTKKNYFGQPLRTTVEMLFKSTATVWDVMSFGYGEIAVALHEHKKLRAIYFEANSISRLKNPVAEKLRQCIDYCEPDDDVSDNIQSSGLVIPYGTQCALDELESLLVKKYAHALVNLQNLEKRGMDSEEFIYQMVQVNSWYAETSEKNLVYLRKFRA